MSKIYSKDSIFKFTEALILLIILCGSIIIVFISQELAFLSIVGGCVVCSWLVYKKGLLGIQIPHDISYAEKDRSKTYYRTEPWFNIFQHRQQLFLKVPIGLVIFVVMLAIGTSVYSQIDPLWGEETQILITLCLGGLIAIILVLYSMLIIAFLIKPNPENYLDRLNLTDWLSTLPREELKTTLEDPNTCPRNLILFQKKNYVTEELWAIFSGS